MTSYAECLELERLEQELPTASRARLHLLLACIEGWREEFFEVLNRFWRERGVIAAAADPSTVGSRLHAAAALVSAYALRRKGRGVARVPGIDVLLVLTAERNISRATAAASPRAGLALLMAVADSPEALDALLAELGAGGARTARCCLNPEQACRKLVGARGCDDAEQAWRILVTRSSLFAATLKPAG